MLKLRLKPFETNVQDFRREICGIQLHDEVNQSQHLKSWTHHLSNAVFIPPQARGLWLSTKAIKFKSLQGSNGVFGFEAGGDYFLPHSPQKCVSSITQNSPHASSPTVMVGVRLLCKMSDSLPLLFFFFFGGSAHLQGRSSTKSSELPVEKKWCATWNLTYIWRRGWLLMLERNICRKKQAARRSVSEGGSQCPRFFITWEPKRRIAVQFRLSLLLFSINVKHHFPHFPLAKKVKLNVQPYVKLKWSGKLFSLLVSGLLPRLSNVKLFSAVSLLVASHICVAAGHLYLEVACSSPPHSHCLIISLHFSKLCFTKEYFSRT